LFCCSWPHKLGHNVRDACAAAELLPVLQLLQQVCRVDNLLQTAVAAWLAACDGFPAFISWFSSSEDNQAALQTYSARAWFDVVSNMLQLVPPAARPSQKTGQECAWHAEQPL
jgi:hypothetical protein